MFFKLLRQVGVWLSANDQNFKFYMEQMYEEFDTISDKKGTNVLIFLNGANLEIMRRLLLILNDNIVYGDPRWNSVLGVQINSLLEINQIKRSL